MKMIHGASHCLRARAWKCVMAELGSSSALRRSVREASTPGPASFGACAWYCRRVALRLLFGLLATRVLLPRSGRLEDHVGEPMRAGISHSEHPRSRPSVVWYTPERGGTAMTIEFGLLLPTREAVMSGRPETGPILAMAELGRARPDRGPPRPRRGGTDDPGGRHRGRRAGHPQGIRECGRSFRAPHRPLPGDPGDLSGAVAPRRRELPRQALHARGRHHGAEAPSRGGAAHLDRGQRPDSPP